MYNYRNYNQKEGRELKKFIESTSKFFLNKQIKTYIEQNTDRERTWKQVGSIKQLQNGRYQAMMVFKEWE